MCLFVACDIRTEANNKNGVNLTEKEQQKLAEKFRRACWDFYYDRRDNGLTTYIDETGVLRPQE